MSDNIIDVHRRALSDYRIALGLELRSRRKNAGYSFEKLASRSNIPVETLRSYKKGTSLPHRVGLVDIGNVYSVTLFDILESTRNTFTVRAAIQHLIAPVPQLTKSPSAQSSCTAASRLAQLRMMEVHPRRCETISEDLFGE
jgi:transcriptional regulator with XRE-family HTH domain